MLTSVLILPVLLVLANASPLPAAAPKAKIACVMTAPYDISMTPDNFLRVAEDLCADTMHGTLHASDLTLKNQQFRGICKDVVASSLKVTSAKVRGVSYSCT